MSGEVFETAIPLRWGDMDSLGHLNNAVAVTLLEEGRVRFLQHAAPAALETDAAPDREFGLVAARHEIDYVVPVYYSDKPVRLRVWIARIGTASFTFGCEIVDPNDMVAVRAKTVVVAIKPDGSGSHPLPPEVRTMLARYLPSGPPPAA